MEHVPAPAFPGELASAEQIVRLADEYLTAARCLRRAARRGHPLSYAPYRLTAIHAIELYLNALLVASGEPADGVRRHGHDLAGRAAFAQACGLRLRGKTVACLGRLSSARAYLAARYAAEAPAPPSDVSQLEAALADVAGKVRAHLQRSPAPPAPGVARPS